MGLREREAGRVEPKPADRYLIVAPDGPTYEHVLTLLRESGVRVWLELEQRRAVSTGPLEPWLIERLVALEAQVAPEEQLAPH